MKFYYRYYIFYFFLFFSKISYPQTDDYKFELNEVEIEFSGTHYFEINDLKSLIKTADSKYLDFSEINNDIQRLRIFYFDNGFFDSAVDTVINMRYKSKKADIKFIIKENNQYLINNISYLGLEKINQTILDEIYKENNKIVNVGIPYNRNQISTEIFRILNVLNNSGFAEAVFEPPEIEKIISNDVNRKYKVNVFLKFVPKRRYIINKINFDVKNNKFNISEEYFRRELELNENEYYNKENYILSENKLNKVTIVDYARIQITNIDTIKNTLDLQINIQLMDKFELSPEIFGYDITNRFFGGVGLSFSDRFFLHGGRNLTTSARFLYHTTDVNALELNFSLFQPYIFNNYKIKGDWELKVTRFEEDIYRISSVKNNFRIGYELPKFTFFNNLYTNWKLSNDGYLIKELNVEVTSDSSVLLPEQRLNIFSSVIGLTFIHNDIDDYSYPTKGNIINLSVEESGLLGELLKNTFDLSLIKYFKINSLNTAYFRLSESGSSTLAAKFLLGMIFEYGDNRLYINNRLYDISIIPYDARFIAGGSTSVRGWKARKLGTFPEKENGGNFLIEGSIEYRVKPFMNSEGIFKSLGFVSFLDFGNLWQEVKYFRYDQIAMAIGFGIRYYTIVGPVRLDFGFKLYDFDPASETKIWLFNNNFKTIFSNKLEIQFGIGSTF
jgi:outer membrane protein insertion porin family